MAKVNLSGCFLPLFGGPLIAISSSGDDLGTCDLPLFGGPIIVNTGLPTEPEGSGPAPGTVPGLFFAHG